MQTTPMFIYHQRYRVISLDQENYHNRRYYLPYTRNLKAHRGTDNRILIEFVNQDQKPVSLLHKTFTLRILDEVGEELLLELPLEIINAERGQTRFLLSEQDLDSMEPGLKHFAIEQRTEIYSTPEDENEVPVLLDVFFEPVYVDDYAGARGQIDILDSVMPEFIKSKTLTIPDIAPAPDYTSSTIETDAVLQYTFQIKLDDYTGDIIVEGSTDTDGLWYSITESTHVLETATRGINTVGYHPFIRIRFADNTNGAIEEIIYR